MDQKVAGLITWKAASGENLNFAVPSKLLSTLLTNSEVHSLGSAPKSEAPLSTSASEERVWTSMTTARDYKLRMDGEHIYMQWVNIPSNLAATQAFARADLKKLGTKWVGKSVSYLPYATRISQVWCRIEAEMEIDSITDSRIEGKSTAWQSTNVKKCQPVKPELKDFVLIPK
jgi:hypothetical protein